MPSIDETERRRLSLSARRTSLARSGSNSARRASSLPAPTGISDPDVSRIRGSRRYSTAIPCGIPESGSQRPTSSISRRTSAPPRRLSYLQRPISRTSLTSCNLEEEPTGPPPPPPTIVTPDAEQPPPRSTGWGRVREQLHRETSSGDQFAAGDGTKKPNLHLFPTIKGFSNGVCYNCHKA